MEELKKIIIIIMVIKAIMEVDKIKISNKWLLIRMTLMKMKEQHKPQVQTFQEDLLLIKVT